MDTIWENKMMPSDGTRLLFGNSDYADRRTLSASSLSPSMEQKSSVAKLLEQKTPWPSIFTTAAMLFFVGLQMSVFFTSTWQYISSVHPQATMDLFGWVIGACALGCALANPAFGFWNQRTLSTKHPLTVGFAIAGLGNLLYGLLPLIPLPILSATMIVSRFFTGFGAGTLGILRGFIATASTRQDRIRAVSLGTSGLTAGLSLGPALQICFLPLGPEGFTIGPIIFNMYTSAAFFMFFITCAAILMANCVLVEDYAGIISAEDKKEDPFTVIPRFDRVPLAVLFLYWFLFCGIASTEGLAAPITMAMYNWSSEEAVLYNGIIQVVNCLCSTGVYLLFATTRIGQWDKRYHLAVGLTAFLFFHAIHLPWPFYESPLNRTPIVNGSMVTGAGGCSWDYDWCDYTPRVPLRLYLVAASSVMGVAFPLVSAPCNTLLSEIVGPRKQGIVQGLFAFTGSMAQFAVPIVSSFLFEKSGYAYIMGYHVVTLLSALCLLFLFRKRLVPLALVPPLGLPTKYKSGTLYRM